MDLCPRIVEEDPIADPFPLPHSFVYLRLKEDFENKSDKDYAKRHIEHLVIKEFY